MRRPLLLLNDRPFDSCAYRVFTHRRGIRFGGYIPRLHNLSNERYHGLAVKHDDDEKIDRRTRQEFTILTGERPRNKGATYMSDRDKES